MAKCRITVVKRTLNQDLIDEYLSEKYEGLGSCTAFEDNQEFLIEDFPSKPEGFCDWAWASIHKDVVAMMFGATYPWPKEAGTAITCCTDGFRPVIFKVERVD
jgi:uncharacterized repeat protein (TIGR04076 family)